MGLLSSNGSANEPLWTLTNTANDATGPKIRFILDKGAAGADDDVAGTVEFYADDDNQDNILFAKIEGYVVDASNGAEGGGMKLYVATHDGEAQPGLTLVDGSAEDEVDATIGNGTSSVVTVAGDLKVTTDIILDDGGSLKEASGTAAITFDGSGHVTKIGQDSFQDQLGAKVVQKPPPGPPRPLPRPLQTSIFLRFGNFIFSFPGRLP